ncbi:MAG: beta-ketoacyl-ACP synthase III [Candidatus Puniceispirillales bacterium]|jgi:3-oxoacyl-[acyl-carrier-protein] synthase-3|tara:strand:- start:222 stop:1205 length:984 start_codon:yes stop_codon:yes gene_type:complete
MSDVILMTGVGSYLPKNKFSNEDLSQFIDTSDEWITKRSGIKSRHFVSKNELTSDLATNAALKAIKMSELNINDIDLIIVATTTPDNTFPSTATRVQQKLGAKGIAFDVQAVCAGFVFALSVASSMMKDNHSKNCIVIGADSMSKLLNWEDRTTSVLFGDGAGAVVLQKEENLDKKFDGWGILSNVIHSDGNFYNLLCTNSGVSLNQKVGFIEMVGKEIFKHAVEKLCSSFQEALDLCNKNISHIDWLIPHQANQRILSAVSDKLKIKNEKVISTVEFHGNTSAASIPLALDVAIASKKVKNGNIIGLQAIGGGLSWGSSIIKFGKP